MNRPQRIPLARLSDVQTHSDGFYNDIAHAIFHTEVRAYRTAILAGDHNDIEATGEAIREAIVRALKDNAPLSAPMQRGEDTCRNG